MNYSRPIIDSNDDDYKDLQNTKGHDVSVDDNDCDDKCDCDDD